MILLNWEIAVNGSWIHAFYFILFLGGGGEVNIHDHIKYFLQTPLLMNKRLQISNNKLRLTVKELGYGPQNATMILPDRSLWYCESFGTLLAHRDLKFTKHAENYILKQ